VTLSGIERWESFAGFSDFLRMPGPWFAAVDLPLGLPLEFVKDQGWSPDWTSMVDQVSRLSRAEWVALLDAHREPRPPGNKLPHRKTDRPAGSHSPLKRVNPPVALMFHAGAPQLKAAGVRIPGMHPGDPLRIVVEAYPGLWARRLVRGSYKADDRARQTPERRRARLVILEALEQGAIEGLSLEVADTTLRASLVDDPTGDSLDAAICCMQAAWCACNKPPLYGLPGDFPACEGWIPTSTDPGKSPVTGAAPGTSDTCQGLNLA
jgi:hypothetical protein